VEGSARAPDCLEPGGQDEVFSIDKEGRYARQLGQLDGNGTLSPVWQPDRFAQYRPNALPPFEAEEIRIKTGGSIARLYFRKFEPDGKVPLSRISVQAANPAMHERAILNQDSASASDISGDPGFDELAYRVLVRNHASQPDRDLE